ncbi:MAG: immunoglobulin domain-containing protein [Oleiphilaceae bacterium]|nr:immunoglobulin domain-containing protein [Oleiphilaceae bacterium]
MRGLRSFLAVIGCCLLVAACSGGGNQNDTQTKSVNGQAIKGLIQNATVTWSLAGTTDVLGQSRTDAKGRFEFNLPTSLSPGSVLHLVLQSDTDTRMRCDHPLGCDQHDGGRSDFGTWMQLPDTFTLHGFYIVGQSSQINLSPFSHLTVGTALQLPGGLSAQNIAIARDWINQSFRLNYQGHRVWPDISATSEISNSANEVLALAVYTAAFLPQILSNDWQLVPRLDDIDLLAIILEAARIADALQYQVAEADQTRIRSLAETAQDHATGLQHTPLQIISHPQSQTLNEGEGLVLRVDAQTSESHMSIQWFHDGTVIPGATSTTLSIPNTVTSDSGVYYASVSDSDEFLQSNAALVTVNEVIQPVVLNQVPQGVSVTEGQSFTLNVVAGGDGPFTYQWQKGGSILPGESGNQLHVSSAELSDAGSYRVIVSNAVSQVQSDFVQVVVTASIAPVQIVDHPDSVSTASGSNASFFVNATGDGFIRYQWLKDGTALTNATQSSLQLFNVSEADIGNYSVQVSNSQGSVMSQSARLEVFTPSNFHISSHPNSLSVDAGDSAHFSVGVSGGNNLNFQWFVDGIELVGATSSTLSINAVQQIDEGVYSVRVSDGSQTLTSNGALLTVNALPSLVLNWDIPEQREDGSALALHEIAGYRIEYGYASNSFSGVVTINEATTTSHTLNDLNRGTIYLRIATIDNDGRQGAFSPTITVDL